MKKRYSVIVWSALVCLIGLSWMGTRFGMSAWQFGGAGMIGMLIAGVFGLIGTHRTVRTRAPAVLALVASLPLLVGMIHLAFGIVDVIRFFGPPFLLVFAGSFATSIAALAVAVMPLPKPSTLPQVAEARVVED